MKHIHLLLVLLIAVGVSLVSAPPGFAQAITFDDSQPTLIVLGNSFYEVGIAKTNGAIAYISDKTTGQHVSEGSRYGCLWGAYGSQTGYIGGCSYTAGGASSFSYTWSAPDARLTLRYTPNPGGIRSATALVTLTASTDHWFDLQLQLDNHLGGPLDYILFPSDLVFREADLQEVYLPVLPGIVLGPQFFAQNRSYVAAYPGELFADFMAVTSQHGTLAIASLYDEAAGIRPLILGLNHDDGYLADSTDYYHSFGARVPDGTEWVSPRVRVRVAQPVIDTIQAYRSDTGIDRFDSLESKAGPSYQQLVRSPLYKADATQLALPFAQYPAMLARVPPPGILHLLAFQHRGFDENYPDMLPPDAAWGSTADLAAMIRQAQALGFLVMPYTNPTWWDDESPTLQALIAAGALADVAVFDTPTEPRYERYGSHGGYVVSPYASRVRERLHQLAADMTVSIPGDLVFEDQVGARSWLFDHNPASPHPTAYAQGWLDHTRVYRSTGLMTEGGIDRLAETELGFHGSVMLTDQRGQADGQWGNAGWRPYPIAPLMMRDKVLFYQHDLAPETFTTNKATLAWNMAFGYLLSYDLGKTNFGGGIDDSWLSVVAAFQGDVLARYAGERMLSYTSLEGVATLSAFESFAVVTNWSTDTPYTTGGYVLPPTSAMVTSADGSLIAGVFTSYRGRPLGSGEHYLIEERGADEIIVRQPMGSDTALTIPSLPAWAGAGVPTVWAISATGVLLGSVPSATTADGVTFTYQRQRNGVEVAYYRIAPGYRSFMPMMGQ